MKDCVTKAEMLEYWKEIVDKEQELRHDQAKVFQQTILKWSERVDMIYEKIEDHRTELALVNQQQGNMQKDIDKIADWIDLINWKLDNLPKTFATKEEHGNNSKRIKSIENGIWWFIWIVWVAIVWAVLKLILI